MSARVFAFEHHGYTFAVPHARVTRVLASLPEGERDTPLTRLGDEVDVDVKSTKHGAVEVYIELDAGAHRVLVRARTPELADLDRPMPLSRVLRGVIDLAHVVGWGEIEEHIVWLIDPGRLTEVALKSPP